MPELEAHLEHIDVVVIVLDVQNFRHEATSGTWFLPRALATTRRTICTRCAGSKEFFGKILSTPELIRLQSASVRSSAVITMTGIPRQFSKIFRDNLHAIAFEHKRKRESYFALAGQK